MRHVIPAALAAALTLVALGGIAAADGSCELGCPNACPLAKSANEYRSNGSEGFASSKVIREDTRREILAGLARV